MISLEDAGGAEEREVWASQLDALMLLQVQLHRRVDHGVAARLSSSLRSANSRADR